MSPCPEVFSRRCGFGIGPIFWPIELPRAFGFPQIVSRGVNEEIFRACSDFLGPILASMELGGIFNPFTVDLP